MLNKRQLDFCKYYVETGVAAQAAKLAGYSEKSTYSQSSKLLDVPEIAEKIHELEIERNILQENKLTTAKIAMNEIVDAAYVLKEAKEIYERCKKVGIEENDIRAFNTSFKYLELLGRHIDVSAFDSKVKFECGESLAEMMAAADLRLRTSD